MKAALDSRTHERVLPGQGWVIETNPRVLALDDADFSRTWTTRSRPSSSATVRPSWPPGSCAEAGLAARAVLGRGDGVTGELIAALSE